MGSGGAFLSDLSGDLGGPASAPGHLEATSKQLLRGLDPVPALPRGRPGKRDLRRFLGWTFDTVLIFILFLGSRVIDFLQQQLARALEARFE